MKSLHEKMVEVLCNEWAAKMRCIDCELCDGHHSAEVCAERVREHAEKTARGLLAAIPEEDDE